MRSATALIAVLLCATGLRAEEPLPVAVELVLALDSSASIDRREFALQLKGIAAAFRDPEVLSAVENLKPAGAAIAVLEWGEAGNSKLVVPWTNVASARDAKALAYVIGLAQRWQRASSTSIAAAIADGRRAIEGNGFEGLRRVIDISGDGPDNGSLDLAEARRQAKAAGITVNGLAIEAETKDLSDYYRKEVITGADSFVETARDYDDFVRAIRDKLLRELRPVQS